MRDREPAGASHQHQGPPIPIPFRGISRLCSQEKFPLGFRRRRIRRRQFASRPGYAPRRRCFRGKRKQRRHEAIVAVEWRAWTWTGFQRGQERTLPRIGIFRNKNVAILKTPRRARVAGGQNPWIWRPNHGAAVGGFLPFEESAVNNSNAQIAVIDRPMGRLATTRQKAVTAVVFNLLNSAAYSC